MKIFEAKYCIFSSVEERWEECGSHVRKTSIPSGNKLAKFMGVGERRSQSDNKTGNREGQEGGVI